MCLGERCQRSARRRRRPISPLKSKAISEQTGDGNASNLPFTYKESVKQKLKLTSFPFQSPKRMCFLSSTSTCLILQKMSCNTEKELRPAIDRRGMPSISAPPSHPFDSLAAALREQQIDSPAGATAMPHRPNTRKSARNIKPCMYEERALAKHKLHAYD